MQKGEIIENGVEKLGSTQTIKGDLGITSAVNDFGHLLGDPGVDCRFDSSHTPLSQLLDRV